MKHRSGLIGVVYAALLSAVIGFFFHASLLSGGSAIPLVAFSILMLLVFALAAVSLDKHSAFADVFPPSKQDLCFSLLGAAGLLAGCLLSFRGSTLRMLLSLLGLLAALGLGTAAVLRFRGKKPTAAWYVLAILFYVVRLFRDFRHWEQDPDIWNYCFSLFAMISFMLATYHAGAFCFDRGARRRLAFYSLAGIFFGAVSLSGADTSTLLVYGGSLLWMLALAQQSLKKA